MAAAVASSSPPKKKEKLPKGVGRVPEWWLEITPHDTLFLEEDEARRQTEQEQAQLFARKAAEYDLMQKYGGDGYPNWNPSEDGPRTKEEQDEWITKGYTRNESTNQWSDASGTPLEGRQFKGTAPPGYVPGQFGPGGVYDPAKFGTAGLHSAAYAQDEKKNWSKPDWMKVKLKSTGKGNAIRGGDPYAAGPDKKINKTTGATATAGGVLRSNNDPPTTTTDHMMDTTEMEAAAAADASESFEDIGSAAAPGAAMSPELQKIMNRRAQTND